MSNTQFEKDIEKLLEKIEESDAILVGAASGMSAAAGYTHYYVRDKYFVEHFGEYEKKYRFHSTFEGAYYPYSTNSETWGFMSKFIADLYEDPIGQPYYDLMKLLEGKNYHILTTNQDLQFVKYGIPDEKLSQIQGEWRYLQCGKPCHDKLYDAVEPIKKMAAAIDDDLCVPDELIPRCPKCGEPMIMWVRGREFLEGERYRYEYKKTNQFIEANKDKKILFLELGVGRMTPMFIQQPFWNLTYNLPKAYYITINPKDALLPREISKKGYAIKDDIAAIFREACIMKEGMLNEQN